jgi:hypothetical protein
MTCVRNREQDEVKTEDKKSLTAPCGLDCFNCEIYEENLTDEIAELVHSKLGVPKQAIPCKGCRQQDGKHYHFPSDGCATLNCVKARGLEFCCDCDEFPCAYLAPIADGAGLYPHNMKVYNLCRIKKVALERWVEEESGEIRRKYFKGAFVVGRGQSD